jgi:hypothetical protein
LPDVSAPVPLASAAGSVETAYIPEFFRMGPQVLRNSAVVHELEVHP